MVEPSPWADPTSSANLPSANPAAADPTSANPANPALRSPSPDQAGAASAYPANPGTYPPPAYPANPGTYPPPAYPTVPTQPYPGTYPPPAPPPPAAYPVSAMPASGYGGYAGYGVQPGYAPAYATPAKNNGLAVAAMVTSIVGGALLFCYGVGVVPGIIGAVLGHVARRQIRERGEGGDGMALAGVIVGWSVAGLGILIIGLLIAFFATALSTVGDPTVYNYSIRLVLGR